MWQTAKDKKTSWVGGEYCRLNVGYWPNQALHLDRAARCANKGWPAVESWSPARSSRERSTAGDLEALGTLKLIIF